MIINISGPVGSGKGTVARILAERLGYRHLSTGDFRRIEAKKRGMTLEEFNKLGETEAFTDRDADDWQRRLGETGDDIVLDSRLGWYFIPDSVKIYLDVDDDVAAQRVFTDRQNKNRINQAITDSIEEQKRLSIERDESDKRRYQKIYGIEDFTDPSYYDLVIDTSNFKPEEIVHQIIRFLQKS